MKFPISKKPFLLIIGIVILTKTWMLCTVHMRTIHHGEAVLFSGVMNNAPRLDRRSIKPYTLEPETSHKYKLNTSCLEKFKSGDKTRKNLRAVSVKNGAPRTWVDFVQICDCLYELGFGEKL